LAALTTRVDQLLVQRGLAPTRSAAQRLIAAGAVQWLGPQGWSAPKKAGDVLPTRCELKVTDDAETRWVSRGGLKLEGALVHTGLDLKGLRVLDLGQSTGGFSEVCLHAGASAVVGVDVGHGQLHPRLRGDARLRCIEGVNARELTLDDVGGEPFDLAVGDLSFISLTLVLPAVAPLARTLLLLVKPQFELQPGQIGKGGLVKDEASVAEVEHKLRDAAQALGLTVRDYFASPIAGGDGNREFFIWIES
jgi:23S rRNA (cytidine1920-2'-O)/16S rRNA (cytidine1409-2'-O)-methyltransferase